jgi:hypothetical protein
MRAAIPFPFDWLRGSTIFPGMPDAKDRAGAGVQRVLHFVVADEQPADLAGFKPADSLAYAKVFDEAVCGG